MFRDEVAHAVIAAAKQNRIDPAALLALVEVETGGKTFEVDGRTPQLLYERHVAYREAKARSKGLLARFQLAGLAIPHWSRSTQYRDERTSRMRLALIAKARAIDPEVANRSASWGIGQTMGFQAENIGFANACAMVAHMEGSLSGQVDCLIGELRHDDIIKSLNAHDWKRVARLYNGPGYAQNRYDMHLRSAYIRWSRKLPQLYATPPAPAVPMPPRRPPPEQMLAPDEVRDIQNKLRGLGYHEVGTIDGDWGSKTTAALSAFQAHEGLTVSGHYDDQTKAALATAEVARPVATDRKDATVDDLRDAGSDTIKQADKLSKIGNLKKIVGGGILAGGAADKLDQASSTLDQLDQARSIWGRIHDLLGPLGDPKVLAVGAVLLVLGIAIAFLAEEIRSNRLKDHQTGEHAGPT